MYTIYLLMSVLVFTSLSKGCLLVTAYFGLQFVDDASLLVLKAKKTQQNVIPIL